MKEKIKNTKGERKPQINIGNVDVEIKRQWEILKHHNGASNEISNHGLLAKLVNFYVANNESVFNEQEQKVVTQVEDIEKMNISQLMKKATLVYCNKFIKDRKKGHVGHIKTIAADARIDDLVKFMMDFNNAKKVHDEKIYINQTSLLAFAKDKNQTFSMEVVKRYLLKNQDMLNKHHQSNNMTETHNRDVANAKKVHVHEVI